MKLLTLFFALANFFITPIAYGDGLKEFIPLEFERPFPICQEKGSPKKHREFKSTLDAAFNSFKCGRYESAYEDLSMAMEIIEETQRGGGRLGWCYSKIRCHGRRLGTQRTTQDTCDFIGGASWQQDKPKKGKCKDL